MELDYTDPKIESQFAHFGESFAKFAIKKYGHEKFGELMQKNSSTDSLTNEAIELYEEYLEIIKQDDFYDDKFIKSFESWLSKIKENSVNISD